MKKYLFLFVCVMGIYAASAQTTDKSKMEGFSWLLGNWQMPKKERMITESWQQSNDSTLEGVSYLVKENGDRVLLEKIQFVFRENQYWYIPTVSDQNNQQPVKFKVTSFTKEKFVADNPQHDFPKQIIYESTGKDMLQAQINDGNNPPVKKSDFNYTRQNN